MISLDNIINSLEESIILFDRKTRIIYLNKTAEELLRRSSKDVINRKLSQVLPGENTISPLIKKAIDEGRSFRGKSASLNTGQLINMDFSLSPLFAHDMIEGALLSINENISIADREDYDFEPIVYMLGSIAHEIKNPLGGIKGAAQLMRSSLEGDVMKEHIDLIIRETDRLNAILQDYLTICKQPSFNRVNIHEVMEKALSIMAVPLKKEVITIKRFYDPSLPQIRGDEAKLLQVFLNIIKNAVESMEKNGKLEVSTYPSKESFRDHGRIKRWALVSIRDTGRGIEQEDLKKIFVPFYTKKKHGTGIGLALSQKIIKDHGGFIKVESRKTRGTTFYIYIPFEHDGKEDISN